MQTMIGLDIGTTSISLVVIDTQGGETLLTRTVTHESRLPDDVPGAYIQSPETILSIAMDLIGSTVDRYSRSGTVESIGVSGQMHGILLVDARGKAVSPVYTWLDMRAGHTGSDGMSHVSSLEQLTGGRIPPGYGAATLHALARTDALPPAAVTFCTVTDYVAMHLAGASAPSMDPTLAHSLGLFPPKGTDFQRDAWRRISHLRPPDVLPCTTVIGRFRGTVPVTAASGDNQAGFLASVRDTPRAVQISIGTSSQISFIHPRGANRRVNPNINPDARPEAQLTGTPHGVNSNINLDARRESGETAYNRTQMSTGEAAACTPAGNPEGNPALDARPFPTGETLMVGAGITGGKSFDVLTGFIEDAARRIGGDADFNAYSILDEFRTPPAGIDPPVVETTFRGTRLNPDRTGAVRGITLENFTIEGLFWGFARGIVEELYRMIVPEGTGSLPGNTLGASPGIQGGPLPGASPVVQGGPSSRASPGIQGAPLPGPSPGLPRGLPAGILGMPGFHVVASGNAMKKNPALRRAVAERFGCPLLFPEHEESAARGAALIGFAGRSGGAAVLPELVGRTAAYSTG